MNQSLMLSETLSSVLDAVEAAGLFSSLATVTRRPADGGGAPVVDALGQVDTDPADYTPVSGLIDIPCMLGVFRMKPDIAATVRLEDRFDTLQERHCILDGYFPEILQRDLLTVDGAIYEIEAVEHDSQATFTRLAVRIFTQ